MDSVTICLIIFVLTIISFIWGKLSLATTALLSMMLFILTGCLQPSTALGYFGNANTLMLACMFIVGNGFNRTQFVKKMAHKFSDLAKGDMRKILIGYVLLAALMSQVIESPLVVITITAPLLRITCEENNMSPSKTMFGLGITALATSGIFPIGGALSMVAQLNGYLETYEYATYQMQLTDMFWGRWPILVACILYAIFLAPKFAPEVPPVAPAGKSAEAKNRPALKPFQEYSAIIIFALVTIGMLCQKQIGLALWEIALLGALAMVITGVMKSAEAPAAIPWGIVLLYVGSLAIGGALTEVGAADVIGNIFSSAISSLGNPYLIGLAFYLVPFIITQFMMNRAVSAIFIPIAIMSCKAMGVNPIGPMLLVHCACMTAFMTPSAAPLVPVFMAEGGYDFKSLLKQSVFPALLFSVVSVAWVITIFPL